MKRIVMIAMVFILLLAGCKDPNPTFTDSATQGIATSIPATTEPSIEEPPEIVLPFQAQYIRTDGYHENFQYPGVAVLDSVQDLKDYYNCYYELYDLAPRSDISSRDTLAFGNACSKYGEAFFSENFLIFVIMQEPSGSIRHEVTDAYKHPSEGIGIHIRRDVPEIGTDDMAQWHIILELERRWLVETPNDVRVFIDEKLAWDGAEVVNPQPSVSFNDPPEGTLFTPTGQYTLVKGGYHWTRQLADGTMETVIADQVSRPLPQDSMSMITIAPEHKETVYALDPATNTCMATRSAGYPVKLSWEVMPDTVELCCWGDGIYINENVEPEAVYSMDNASFYANPGAYVYEIIATWKDLGNGTGGSCHYYAYIFGGAEEFQQYTGGNT